MHSLRSLMTLLRAVFACTFRCDIGRVWTTEPDAELPIKMGVTGLSARSPMTVFEVFNKCVEDRGEKPALKYKNISQVKLTGGHRLNTGVRFYTSGRDDDRG